MKRQKAVALVMMAAGAIIAVSGANAEEAIFRDGTWTAEPKPAEGTPGGELTLIRKLLREGENRRALRRADELIETIRPVLAETFKPALLGRMSVTPYYPLTPGEIGEIARLKLGKIQRRFAESHRAELTYDPGVIEYTVVHATDVASGARTIDGILNNNLLPQLSTMILQRMADEQNFDQVHIKCSEDGSFQFLFS